MITRQITLSEAEYQAVQIISERRGQTHEETLHEAVEQFLKGQPQPSSAQQVESRLAAMRQARGMLKDEKNPFDFSGLREEWDRF